MNTFFSRKIFLSPCLVIPASFSGNPDLSVFIFPKCQNPFFNSHAGFNIGLIYQNVCCHYSLKDLDYGFRRNDETQGGEDLSGKRCVHRLAIKRSEDKGFCFQDLSRYVPVSEQVSKTRPGQNMITFFLNCDYKSLSSCVRENKLALRKYLTSLSSQEINELRKNILNNNRIIF